MVIIEPFLCRIPVLSLSERVLQTALHLLNKPWEPTFDGQDAATDPLAAPIPVLLSFPDLFDFAARRQPPLPHRIPRQGYHPRLWGVHYLRHHKQHLGPKNGSSCCHHLVYFLLLLLECHEPVRSYFASSQIVQYYYCPKYWLLLDTMQHSAHTGHS